MRHLYTKEFVWLIPNDDNRVEDGRDLRYEFMDDESIDEVDPDWMHLGCSVLEMLIGLSRRLAFEAEGEPRDWFWKLLENVGLPLISDADYDQHKEQIDIAFDRVIWRRYDADGYGGLFPLRNPDKDQRKVELWYQAASYILEHD